METKILIVEDEEGIRGFLRINFQRNNYKVLEASSGEEGINIARVEKPKVAILDVMLPGIDGFMVCETLRKEFPSMGIIMLTAKGQDLDKIMGLECGADDYVVKPFNPTELILRTKALIRRSSENNEVTENRMIESYPFKIDTYSQKIYKGEIELELTPKEYMLMKIFIENPEKAFSRDELLNLVWGYNFIGDPKIVDVNIRRLRTKIEETASQPIFIQTVWGTGYRWGK
jgi:two-component system alkaline phosphatase synthesis response regulator PhoP